MTPDEVRVSEEFRRATMPKIFEVPWRVAPNHGNDEFLIQTTDDPPRWVIGENPYDGGGGCVNREVAERVVWAHNSWLKIEGSAAFQAALAQVRADASVLARAQITDAMLDEAEALDALRDLHERTELLDDTHITGGGWQSEALKAALDRADRLLGNRFYLGSNE